MLDRLLGRAGLKTRIADLEEELRHAERRLEAEDRRRSEAVSARQDAEEQVNRLEDRIAELEGRVERQTDRTDDDDADHVFRRTESLHGDRLREVLDRLASFETEPEGALTAMIDDEVPDAVREAFGDRSSLLARAAPCLAVTDDVGLVSVALAPTMAPEPFVTWADGFEIEPEWFVPTGEFAFALVRSDLFALGEYDGEQRRSFTGFESDVKSAHSKGGFSQGRFERRRDGQIDAHLDECRELLDDRDADRLFVVGERTVLGEFADDAIRTATVDATGDPEEALDAAFRDFWTTQLYAI